MASVGFGTVAPAAPAGTRVLGRRAGRPSPSFARVPATKVVTSAAKKQEEKGLFDTIFGALYKEDQLLETDPILNKVNSKAKKPAAGKSEMAEGNGGGFSLGGLFSSNKE